MHEALRLTVCLRILRWRTNVSNSIETVKIFTFLFEKRRAVITHNSFRQTEVSEDLPQRLYCSCRVRVFGTMYACILRTRADQRQLLVSKKRSGVMHM